MTDIIIFAREKYPYIRTRSTPVGYKDLCSSGRAGIAPELILALDRQGVITVGQVEINEIDEIAICEAVPL